MSKFYITTPIYYSNGDPHIGSAYPTIACDVLARYNRLIGNETFFLTGVDEHGAKMADTASQNNLEPQAYCDLTAAKFQLCWDELNISNDDFIRTTSTRHKKGVVTFIEALKKSDSIYEGVYEGLYCQGCEAFLTERDLVDGKCPIHNKAPQLIEEKNYFFNLKKYLPQLEKIIDNDEIQIVPENKKKEVLGLFKQEMGDFSISRSSLKWGIPFPGNDEQVVYVWADALTNYITALGYGSENNELFDKFWPADVHIVGKDIIKFHCIFWPAMLLAANLPVPKKIYAHGFFTVDGQKMGKSMGNMIDPITLVREFGVDATRYLLLSQFPFGQDGDIKYGDFAIQYNSDLANGVGNLVSRVLAMAEKYFSYQVPAKDDILKKEIESYWSEYQTAANGLQVDQMIAVIKKVVTLGDTFVDSQKPWELAKNNDERLPAVIYSLMELIRHLALMSYPVMPETAEKIQAVLNCSEWQKTSFTELIKWGGLESNSSVQKHEPLFPRLIK